MAGRAKKKGKLVPGEAAMIEANAVANRLIQASQPAAGADINLTQVIAELYKILRMASERAEKDPQTKELLQILYGVGLAGTRLASMLKTQRELSDEPDSGQQISEMIEKLMKQVQGTQKG